MSTAELNAKLRDRLAVIRSVNTPLGFFVLVVLVVEVAFGSAAIAFDDYRWLLFVGMITIMILLILLVAAMAIWRPDSLYGVPRVLIDIRRSTANLFRLFKRTLVACSPEDIKFRLNLLQVDPVSGQIRMYVQDDVYQDRHFEINIVEGLAKGIVICRAVSEGRTISEELPPGQCTFYSDSPIPDTLSAVMASPVRDAAEAIIGVIALDSEIPLRDLAIPSDRLQGLFEHLCDMVEDVIQDADIHVLE